MPSPAEQEAIAESLSDADALIESLQRLIVKKRLLKQGAMQGLLTGQKRMTKFSKELNPSFKNSEIGPIPDDWELRRLEQVSAFITKGATPTTYGFKWQRTGVLFLRSECVSESGLDLAQAMYVSPEAHSVLGRAEVRSGDLLMTITGNVGRVVLLSGTFGVASINQHIARIRINDDNVSPEYVLHFLSQRQVRQHYNSITTGQAYPQISLKQVRDAVVPLPTFPEQKAIACVLSDMDAEIACLQEKLAKARQLKQGMMQELLTGRTRLV
jgi:type I restriction enzyme S subunit